MRARARTALVFALLLSAAAFAGISWDQGPGEWPVRELPRVRVTGLRPHPNTGRSVAPAPATPVAPRPFTVSLDLDGLHVGLPTSDGPALGLTWDGELRPWARLD